MSEGRAWSRILLNVGLGVAVLVLVVLAAGLVVRVFETPGPIVGPAVADAPPGEIIQVEVRNGCGVPGVAGTFTEFLRRRHFDVVASGNWRRFDEPYTRVIDRVGNREAALRVARVLGLDESRVTEELDPRFFVDATIVIGHDFSMLPPYSEAPNR
jgi:hypothetical protein